MPWFSHWYWQFGLNTKSLAPTIGTLDWLLPIHLDQTGWSAQSSQSCLLLQPLFKISYPLMYLVKFSTSAVVVCICFHCSSSQVAAWRWACVTLSRSHFVLSYAENSLPRFCIIVVMSMNGWVLNATGAKQGNVPVKISWLFCTASKIHDMMEEWFSGCVKGVYRVV